MSANHMQRHERFAHFLNKKQQQNTDALKVQNIQRKSVIDVFHSISVCISMLSQLSLVTIIVTHY
ncbi:hypothetical protein DERP_012146 [Dermatophagoides pteronyssinus]|uniref:Uncharacterized protein n=1 Tax=Dermatophagoides pteronyssinus TaxID=6956 RepID=A0ABQ8J297_DERPT|nr:hypothetical protein DERP_012146 [Dermatophagoides pteronyssinus]